MMTTADARRLMGAPGRIDASPAHVPLCAPEQPSDTIGAQRVVAWVVGSAIATVLIGIFAVAWGL